MTHLRAICSSLALFCSPLAAQAQTALDGVVSHRVIPGWTQRDGSHMAGLELTLAPGWKTYWRSPGDAGIPPKFDWTGARNIQDVMVAWPTPTVFWQYGMRSIGYDTKVVLPLTVTPKRDGKAMRLKGRMDLGICSDVCLPAQIRIDAALPPESATRPSALVAALAALPYDSFVAGVKDTHCTITPSETGLNVTASIIVPHTGGTEETVIEPPKPGVWVSEAQTHRSGDTLIATAEMISVSQAPFVIDRSDIRITILGSKHAVDIQGCPG
ncbi:MAG: protein-disulfide reductase DsbD domain-containing protein [Paracoccaceae bacterium]